MERDDRNPMKDDPSADADWERHHRRVLDAAYRLLGSVSEAEDVTQDAFAKLLTVDRDEIRDVRGWLITVVSRLSLDRLRSHDVSRRAYVGPWLPEPLVGDGSEQAPEDRITLDDSVRMALLVVLERMTPAERTAFVLHDVFAFDFAEIGEIVGRSAPACRQLASRARRRLEADAPPRPVDPTEHRSVVDRFARACEAGDLDALLAVLDPEVVGDFDSGGVVPNAPLAELDGSGPVADQLLATVAGRGARFEPTDVNGDPGVVVRIGPRIAAVMALGVRGGRIDLIHAVGNPAKLAHLVLSD